MKTEPRVSTSSVEKLSTLCEEKEHDSSETASIEKTLINDTPAKTPKHELNNNINNNNRKLLLTNQPSTSSLTSIEAAKDHIFFDPNSEPGSPCAKTPSTPSTPTTPTTDAWINTGTWRRRQFSKERTISLKEENEELGLENVIPYHRSPKALSDMGKQIIYSRILVAFPCLCRLSGTEYVDHQGIRCETLCGYRYKLSPSCLVGNLKICLCTIIYHLGSLL